MAVSFMVFLPEEELLEFFEQALSQSLGRRAEAIGYRFLSGGCINQTIVLSSSEGSFCLKYNESGQAVPADLLPAEADGLARLRAAGALPVPEVYGLGQAAGRPYLLMEYLDAGLRQPDYWADLGQNLAVLHGHTAPRYGLDRGNFIGSLEQHNDWMDSGPEFYAQRRILAQAGLALYNEALPLVLFQRLEYLCERLPELLPRERPALLHGDLWSGNVIGNAAGQACLIDPAVNYGLREAEVAFTHLFGGFEEDFYAAYHEAFPLEPGFEQRIGLYNLYPLLVHVNLFGSGYLAGVEAVLDEHSV